MTTIVTENEAELISKLALLIERLSNEALQENGVFKVGVSGNKTQFSVIYRKCSGNVFLLGIPDDLHLPRGHQLVSRAVNVQQQDEPSEEAMADMFADLYHNPRRAG